MSPSTTPVKLSITPLKPSRMPSTNPPSRIDCFCPELPDDAAILAAGKALIDSTPSWKAGKTYHKIVKTFHRPKHAEDGAPWHCRVSEHPASEATFDQIWSKLGADKALHEKEYGHCNHRSSRPLTPQL